MTNSVTQSLKTLQIVSSVDVERFDVTDLLIRVKIKWITKSAWHDNWFVIWKRILQSSLTLSQKNWGGYDVFSINLINNSFTKSNSIS